MKMNKKTVYIVTQYSAEPGPYPEMSSTDNIAVCETRELAEQIKKERDEQSYNKVNPIPDEEWDNWLFYRDEHYPDPEDEAYCIFDNECSETEELEAAIEYFSTIYCDKTKQELSDMITTQWDNEETYHWIYLPCEIEEITYYY